MLRNSISLVTALYAVGFALIALTAVRWPSLLLLAGLFSEGGGAVGQMQDVANWRELGLAYGLVYLVAAFFFCVSSRLIARRALGSVFSYIMGAGLGFAPLFLFDFEPGWWQAPNDFEQGVMFAGALTIIMFGAVWDLSRARKPVGFAPAQPSMQSEILLDRIVLPAGSLSQMAQAPIEAPVKPVRRRQVSPVIARQRACFAAYGRRARARQVR